MSAGRRSPCLLADRGARPTVVEIAPALRRSGFAVDFRGPTQLQALDELGVLVELRARLTHGSAFSAVDEDGREIFHLPAEFTGGELEVYRSDLSRILHQRSGDRVELLFGDSVAALSERTDGVQVKLAGGATRVVDLVIGADGIHSAVRALAFGPESRYVRNLGQNIAGWSLANDFGAGDTNEYFSVPGRTASVGADLRDPARAIALFIFAAADFTASWRDVGRQEQLIREVYAGLPWRVPQLLDGLDGTSDLYFDSIARVAVPTWSSGRVALLGDAAWGLTLGGMGVGTAVVGASVLAEELAAAPGDHVSAFGRCEDRMRRYATRWRRRSNPAKFLAPTTRHGLWLRNRMLGNPVAQRMMLRGTTSMASASGSDSRMQSSAGPRPSWAGLSWYDSCSSRSWSLRPATTLTCRATN